MTQSTVSQAIGKLERTLGAQVLVHARQKVQSTEKGRILFEQAWHVFKAVQDIHGSIHQNKEEVRGIINFACAHSLRMSFIAPALKKCKLSIRRSN